MIRSRRAATAGAALGALVGLAGSAATALWSPLPRTRGRLRLPGLSAPAEVLRDHWGVPHIYAQSSADLLAAQGFVHAQDRLWQMEFGRRLAGGRLAELLGPAALPADRAARVLGLGRLARREAALLDGADRAAAEAYVRGVNACIERLGGRLPVEFRLLRARPAPWTIEDVLLAGKLPALCRLKGWASGRLRPGAQPTAAPHAAPLTCLAALPFVAAAGAGGSAWAVSGAHSASGRPLLACDLYAGMSLPAQWYENHLSGDDLHVAGASLPGTPGVLAGHNRRIAWGMAEALEDAPELFVEEFDPHDRSRYQRDGGWERAEVIYEEIGVRGRAAPLVEAVRITHHGPVVSELAQQSGGDPQTIGEVALRWAALGPGGTLGAVLALNRAHDWPGFRAALEGWAAPAQHVVYADTDGHIGAALAGTAQLAGRQAHVFDPPSGVVVVAGGQLSLAADEPQRHGNYRAARIHSLLGLSGRHTRHSFAHIQNDRLSLPGLELAALAGRLPASTAVQRAARAALASWDGEIRQNSAGAAIYARLRGHLLSLDSRWLAAQPSDASPDGTHRHTTFEHWPHTCEERCAGGQPDDDLPRLLHRIAERGQPWEELLGEAWQRAIAELQAEGGPDVRGWRYAHGQPLQLHHPLGAHPALARLLSRRAFPTGGGSDTVGGSYPAGPRGTDGWAGPSHRQICDLDDWDNGESMLAGGQSGHPASHHYADLVRPWLSGRYYPTPWRVDTVEEAAVDRLTLEG